MHPCTVCVVPQVAWQLVDAILKQVPLDAPSQQLAFAAADVLLDKVRWDLSSLPQADQMALRDSVLVHITKFVPKVGSEGTHPAFGRLCLVVASLVVRVRGWTDIIPSIVASVGSATEALPSLFEILVHIPEEVLTAAACFYHRAACNRAACGRVRRCLGSTTAACLPTSCAQSRSRSRSRRRLCCSCCLTG
jgi:hypothetical protein